jgi:hypothetical protein
VLMADLLFLGISIMEARASLMTSRGSPTAFSGRDAHLLVRVSLLAGRHWCVRAG